MGIISDIFNSIVRNDYEEEDKKIQKIEEEIEEKQKMLMNNKRYRNLINR